MSLQDDKYQLPSTLEPKEDEHSALTVDNMVTDVEPLKNYLSSRQLPALDTLQSNYQNDDYIRIKLSGMSVGVSPNSSPRVQPQYQQEQRAEYFSQGEEERRRFDPIRSSVNNTPLLRRIMHHDPSSQRRHSIANMDLNTRSLHHHEPHIYQPPPPQQSFPGHYSAPSSPPLQHSHQKLNKHPLIPFSPYNGRSKSIMDDDLPPPPMRRNSSALVYRNNNTREHLISSRRMSSSSSSTSSLHRVNQIGNFKEEEDDDDRHEMEGIYSRSPELRISHKLAERKRRKEMKDLFEELKEALPVDKSMKTSKWEILSKAVEYIGMLRHRDYGMEQELVMLKHELESLKSEKPSVQKNYHN
ncbi:hypothetical protein BDF21DRAFT_418269 [Thamnidium elegans]|uniref:BHLH domain-containing protein n=1 Tax=Thamnidium elegans TaxID=101142 RepID=A0A8H7VWS3_9FUNG|nr:hypothetical protein INT48_006121 [Thamnidium elegans]KAI8081031.1 hypothetical protein BDF21DRAFT_418269 [Thamnidium elegans]